MVLPLWPAELPFPDRNGYETGSGESRLMTPVDAGPRRTRRRFSAVSDPWSMSFLFTRNEQSRFDRFYHEETLEGALPFLIPDFAKHGWPVTTHAGNPVLTHDGQPVVMSMIVIVMFSDALPVTRPYGNRFQTSFTLEVMP